MMMPRMDGISLAREIKALADLPIIVLSAIDAGDSKADLLEEVAEDYVTKPYHYPELRARINRVLRRLGDKVPRQSLVLGPELTLDLHRREATVGGKAVSSPRPSRGSSTPWRRTSARSVTTETLLARGWAETEDADPSYVWVTMRRLRQKVEVDPNRPVHLRPSAVSGTGWCRRTIRDAPRRHHPIDERRRRSLVRPCATRRSRSARSPRSSRRHPGAPDPRVDRRRHPADRRWWSWSCSSVLVLVQGPLDPRPRPARSCSSLSR